MRVLLVEADTKSSSRIARGLTLAGVRLEAIDTGKEALELVRHYDFDILLLNLGLPDMSGLEVLRHLRAGRSDMPVLAMMNNLQAQLGMEAFSAGADDVVSLPIDEGELLARMRAIVRRCRGYSKPMLRIGAVTLTSDTRECAVHDKQVQLTGKEYAILELLMLRRNMVLTKDTFLNHLYGGMDEPEAKIIDVFICKLRRKLAIAGAPDFIGTVWGRGYTVRDPGQDTCSIPEPVVGSRQEVTPGVGSARVLRQNLQRNGLLVDS